MNNKSNDSAETVLSLSFQGPEPNGIGVNVVTLSRCLMAVQTLVNKAWLIHENREPNTAKMTAEERRRLSLAIASRKESSDLYCLTPLILDPETQRFLAIGYEKVIELLFGYCVECVLRPQGSRENSNSTDGIGDPEDPAAYRDLRTIEPEITELTKEVNDAGITAVVLRTGIQFGGKSLAIDFEFRKRWENHLKVNQAKGHISLHGRVTSLKIKDFSAELDTGDGMKATLLFGKAQFHAFKLSWDKDSQYQFAGRRTGKVSRKKNTYGKIHVESYQLIGK